MQYPAAEWKPVGNHSGPMSQHLGLVLHVQEGNNSLFGYFNNPANEVSSHFWVGKTGVVEQYVDADTVAWAQANGNSTYLSVETEGYHTEPLTDAQVQALGKLFRWCHDTYSIPLATTDVVGQPGLAWHGMGGAAWGNHPDCPGTLRLSRRPDIVQIAAGAVITPTPPNPTPTPPSPQPPQPSPQPSQGPVYPGRLLVYTPSQPEISGFEVTMWQQKMQDRGWDVKPGGKYGPVDGVYGPKSALLCHDFEVNQHLTVESPFGVVGPEVWRATWNNPITHP